MLRAIITISKQNTQRLMQTSMQFFTFLYEIVPLNTKYTVPFFLKELYISNVFRKKIIKDLLPAKEIEVHRHVGTFF